MEYRWIYFARCYQKPQVVPDEELLERQQSMLHKLSLLQEAPQHAYLQETVTQLQSDAGVVHLFSKDYPQVLNHGDLSETNILVNGETAAVTGFIDWSLGSVRPFGYERYALRQLSGKMTSEGWSDMICRARTDEAFWTEFWSITSIEDPAQRIKIKEQAELVAKLGLIIRYAIQKTLDGIPLDKLATRPARYLASWLTTPNWSSMLLNGRLLRKQTPSVPTFIMLKFPSGRQRSSEGR
ncbi:Uu.00g145340.m01.CDS01 [Anthostomella pinea]|uniref:Uu.00g145340.m01.CDS01 n=1 Tax=Anthostomella pinea TaxID=933095 RepID=A0AAI8VRX3_9PEZI|nr:Uu.00g145340.m01.CDS01 [Anthostomella pinea]